MPTHAELAGKLLDDASTLFRSLGKQNESLQAQMFQNAEVFARMGRTVEADPQGDLEGSTHAELAGRLLMEAASFFRTLGDQNQPLQEQMHENARIYDQVGDLVSRDPLGEVSESQG